MTWLPRRIRRPELRDRSVSSLSRQLLTRGTLQSSSVQITEHAALVFSMTVFNVSAANKVACTLRNGGSAGRGQCGALVSGSSVTTHTQTFKGLLFENGIYADFTGTTAASAFVTVEYIETIDIPWLRNIDNEEVQNVFYPAPARSALFSKRRFNAAYADDPLLDIFTGRRRSSQPGLDEDRESPPPPPNILEPPEPFSP